MTEPESIWTLWRGWRGSPRLLAHVADVCIDGVRTVDDAEPECEISVWVDDDVERFESPAEFLDGVTEDALKRFSCIGLVARAGDGSVAVSLDLARKEHPEREWLKGVVLLEVAALPGGGPAEAPHRSAVAAVSRGTKGDGQGVIEEDGETPEEAVRAWKAKLRRSRLWAIPLTAGSLALLASWIVFGLPFGEGFHGDWIAIVLGGLGGIIPSVAIVLLNPSFEISDQTRAARVMRMLYRAVGPAVGAVAGVVLKMAAG